MSPAQEIHPVRDLATKQATWHIRETSVGEYLTRVGILDAEGNIHEDEFPEAPYQRPKLPLAKNPIKKRMLRDVLRGGTLPPVVLIEQDDRVEIADGLQRTHVLTEAVKVLRALEAKTALEKYAQQQLDEMRESSQEPLSLETFLRQPLVQQVWRDLTPEEKLRLFMVLNVGQQKVSPRHLLEVAQRDLRETFESWGINLLTEKQEKELPRRSRRRDAPPPKVIPLVTHFRYELLIDAIGAYVTADAQLKTKALLEGDAIHDPLSQRFMDIGSEECKVDFQWVCLELNRRVRERYANNAKWVLAVQNNDNFLIPLFAALRKARELAPAGSTVRANQRELLGFIDASDSPDPLGLYQGEDSLQAVQDSIRSNIGRRARAVVYLAWRQFFLRGAVSEDSPLDWRDALVST